MLCRFVFKHVSNYTRACARRLFLFMALGKVMSILNEFLYRLDVTFRQCLYSDKAKDGGEPRRAAQPVRVQAAEASRQLYSLESKN